MRAAGAWFGLGGLLFAAGLAFHAPPSPEPEAFMAAIANDPSRWVFAHTAAAIAASMLAVAGLIVLTAGSRLSRTGVTLSAWAALVVSGLLLTTAALTELTVVTAAATAGDTSTFSIWQPFAEGYAAAFAPLALAVGAIAVAEARSDARVVPETVAWIGGGLGLVAAAAFTAGLGLGIGAAGPVWLVSSILLSLWGVWFGVGLVRADHGGSDRFGRPEPGGPQVAR